MMKFLKNLSNLILGKKIDKALLETLETQLIVADVGLETTKTLMTGLTDRISRKEVNDTEALMTALRQSLFELLLPVEKPLIIPDNIRPFVILVVGVNGAGKTTTIGKIAHLLQQRRQTVLLAAGDTFRAAAIDQLKAWGEKNRIPVIAQQPGADSASVIFDAIGAAKSRGIDVVIADTAGRLHTQQHLMEELKKVKRVITKIDPSAPHETLLVLDANIGQNALRQAEEFHQAIQLTGIALTKLDGTAKGGTLFSIANQLQLPIRFVGFGERIDDLKVFNAQTFINALMAEPVK